jgi:metallo-beta-lactamase family protein
MASSLMFLGAARTVTGSKHLLETGGHRVLVDCGQFQGLKELRERNWQPLPIREETIEAVVLTHAHLDHCGYLPKIVQRGFNGPIYCTPATAELTRVVLEDAAKLQEEDAERANRKGYTKHKPALPLFTVEDAARAIRKLEPTNYNESREILPGVAVEFLNAGHLLGSAFARVRVEEMGGTVLFGGDLGRFERPVLPNPTMVEAADVLLVESTYGDRIHEKDDQGEKLASVIRYTIGRGGKVIIPSFALGRVEELLYWIHRLEAERRIPVVPVYVDSPMSATVLETYRRRLEELDDDVVQQSPAAREERELCAFCTTKLRVLTAIADSRKVQESREPSIVISASGMATGGRVLHHLVHSLPDPRNTILFAGFQSVGTRGRHLKDGAKVVRIHGQDITVRAEIAATDSMSAHADQQEILRWLRRFRQPPKLTCLVHGEPGPMDTLKGVIERELHWNVRTPAHQERIEISAS